MPSTCQQMLTWLEHMRTTPEGARMRGVEEGEKEMRESLEKGTHNPSAAFNTINLHEAMEDECDSQWCVSSAIYVERMPTASTSSYHSALPYSIKQLLRMNAKTIPPA
ncbi:uncharacterized protein F5891DRAFT_1176714 [Suillus fuscotomentosus]|uniref:Uncharacterized protein n=1 Tax=Suillus fuscotomentosus TaxID=1912939 RepID=A0AAD4DRV0_9AGAM|nr:uncharacterized protein F5891DRAFT_1176714 [Suillus fuscotomentosus]KAG1891802.1 hypothetical protein F5891DRAFT_1176714 [Suillus fuscotomentosus]